MRKPEPDPRKVVIYKAVPAPVKIKPAPLRLGEVENQTGQALSPSLDRSMALQNPKSAKIQTYTKRKGITYMSTYS